MSCNDICPAPDHEPGVSTTIEPKVCDPPAPYFRSPDPVTNSQTPPPVVPIEIIWAYVSDSSAFKTENERGLLLVLDFLERAMSMLDKFTLYYH
jgi:hypothetical protein